MTKTALITGAASGIGLSIATHLGENGYQVVLTDADFEAATLAGSKLTEKQLHATAFKLDVTSDDDISRVAQFADTSAGGIDVLINCAGLQHVAKLEDFPVDRWKLLTNVMLVGPAMLTRALLPAMRNNNFGRIVNIGSIHSLIGSPHKSAYVAAKHGLLGFAKVVALETAEQDITINTICPAYVKTPLVEMQIANQALEHGISEEDVINKIMLEPMPKKSFIGIDEIVSAVDYLIGAGAKNMTGQQIVLDGGWTAR